MLQDDDPRLDLALLVLGRVVPAVLAQVPFLPGRFPRLSPARERSRRSCLPRSAYHQVEDEHAGQNQSRPDCGTCRGVGEVMRACGHHRGGDSSRQHESREH